MSVENLFPLLSFIFNSTTLLPSILRLVNYFTCPVSEINILYLPDYKITPCMYDKPPPKSSTFRKIFCLIFRWIQYPRTTVVSIWLPSPLVMQLSSNEIICFVFFACICTSCLPICLYCIMLEIFHSIIERKSFWNSHSVSSFIWACEPKNKNYITLKLLRLWKWNPFWHQYGMLNYCINLSAWQWHNKVHNI